MIGSFGDEHSEMLFEKGPKFRKPKNFTKKFTSDMGIINKAHDKLLVIDKAKSLEEIREITSGSELEKKEAMKKMATSIACGLITNTACAFGNPTMEKETSWQRNLKLPSTIRIQNSFRKVIELKLVISSTSVEAVFYHVDQNQNFCQLQRNFEPTY